VLLCFKEQKKKTMREFPQEIFDHVDYIPCLYLGIFVFDYTSYFFLVIHRLFSSVVSYQCHSTSASDCPTPMSAAPFDTWVRWQKQQVNGSAWNGTIRLEGSILANIMV